MNWLLGNSLLQNTTMDLLYRLKSGWTALKFVRVALGGLILFSAVAEKQLSGIILGLLFTVLALFTDGVCCAGAACYTRPAAKKDDNVENSAYEELGNK